MLLVKHMIKEKLSLVPSKPGCYLMRDERNIIIYVGKAKNLKNRLTSYFNGTHTGKTAALVSNIVDFEYIITKSEVEALVLELNLIKKYDPKYNIMLKDDKSYPYIELTNDKYPTLKVVRNINTKKQKNRKLFGPFPNSFAARKTVDLLNRVYPLRKCKTLLKKPCLYFHINECLGYCATAIDGKAIDEMVGEITRFLKGDDKILVDKIKSKMNFASEKLQFEKALEYKNELEYIEATLDRQKVNLNDNVDRDIFGYFEDKGFLSIQVFFLRGGKLVERKSDIFELVDDVADDMSEYIIKFYDKHNIVPKEVFVPSLIDAFLISEVINTTLLCPQKGEKRKILEMANENAKNALSEKFELIKRDNSKTIDATNELSSKLNRKISRIELFDNSNLFGSFTVSGMVVFIDGIPRKNLYRKFKISVDKNDDYGAMREVLYRRYLRVLKENSDLPDLIIVDGGKGQISAAKEVIDGFNLDVMIVGLKKDDRHRTNKLLLSDYTEIVIDSSSNLFHFLERMQNEVHNYTISYHRQIRSKGSIESVLDNVEGIGSVRKKELIKKFGSVKKMKEATLLELCEILPLAVSEKLMNFLKDW